MDIIKFLIKINNAFYPFGSLCTQCEQLFLQSLIDNNNNRGVTENNYIYIVILTGNIGKSDYALALPFIAKIVFAVFQVL